jgi:GNAT superfamily N-acetyltransferase
MIISFSEALAKLKYSNFESQMQIIATNTFNEWYDTYYKDHLTDYPNAEHITQNFIKVAEGQPADPIYEGFVYYDINTNTIAGIITLNRDELAPYKSDAFVCINNVFVLPEYRNRGIAKKMVKFLMVHTLYTRPYLNQINLFCEKHLIDFYKSLGWTLLSETPQLNYWYEMVWSFNVQIKQMYCEQRYCI